jgi:hypothetical protein
MVDLPVSNLSPTPARPSFRIADAIGTISGFFAQIGAAARVSRAVEARRAPNPADLRILGIDAPLPRNW